MKKLFLLFLGPVTLFLACQKTTDDFVSTFVKETMKHKSMHYKVTEKYYYSNAPDTTITPFEVWAIRDITDTLRNGYIWVDNNYRPYNMIYDAGSLYLAIPPKQATVLYTVFEDDLISPVDWIDNFLKPDILKEQLKSITINSQISDTVYHSALCTKLTIEYPADKKGEKKKFTYILDKVNLVPLWAMMQSRTPDHVYFDELTFSEYEFDKVHPLELKSRQKKILQRNPVKRNGMDSQLSMLEHMLHEKDNAPLFTGKFFSTGKAFRLEDYIGRNIVIIDFWYTHCPPCVRAMPALSDLYTLYKDKGLKIFGINSVDNQPNSLENLRTFLGKRQISYEVILTSPAVDNMYKIQGYPSMYVVDKYGKIVYAEAGYNEEKFKNLKEKVKALIESD